MLFRVAAVPDMVPLSKIGGVPQAERFERLACQQDVIRRICTQPNTSSEDRTQVLANIKTSQGLAETQEIRPVFRQNSAPP